MLKRTFDRIWLFLMGLVLLLGFAGMFYVANAQDVKLGGPPFVPSFTTSQLGAATINFTADGDCTVATLTNCTLSAGNGSPYVATYIVTNSLELTDGRLVILPTAAGRFQLVYNNTTDNEICIGSNSSDCVDIFPQQGYVGFAVGSNYVGFPCDFSAVGMDCNVSNDGSYAWAINGQLVFNIVHQTGQSEPGAACFQGPAYIMTDDGQFLYCNGNPGIFVNPFTGGNSGGGATLSVAQPTPASTTILQAINNAANQAVNIVVFGDSFTICDQTICGAGGGPTVPTNRWPEQLRLALKALQPVHGTGMLPLIFSRTASPSPLNSQYYASTGTYDTNVSALGPTQGGGANNTLVHLDTGATITFSDTRSIAWDTLHVYGATASGSGSLSCMIDGGSAVVLSTGSVSATGAVSGGFTASRWDLSSVTLGTHTVVCTASGDFYLFAFHGTSGTAGVEVHEVGIQGAELGMLSATPTPQMAFYDLIPGGHQAALFMGQTNDAAGSVSTGTFGTNLAQLVTHEQALASAPTVILTIPPVDVVDNTDPMAPYTAVQVAQCASSSLTCLNVQQRGATVAGTDVGWGTAYNASSGLWDLSGTAWPSGQMGVHPNDKGTLDEAQLVYAALLNPTASGGGGSSACTNNCTFTGQTTLDNGTGTSPLVLTGSSSAFTNSVICNTSTGGQCWQQFSTGTNGGVATGWYTLGDTANTGWFSIDPADHTMFLNQTEELAWGNNANSYAGTQTLGLSQESAGVASLDGTTRGDEAGTLRLHALIASDAISTSQLGVSGGAASIGAQPLGTAISGTNFNSAPLYFEGTFYNGTAQFDFWQWQDVMGTGSVPTSTLTLTHTAGATVGTSSVAVESAFRVAPVGTSYSPFSIDVTDATTGDSTLVNELGNVIFNTYGTSAQAYYTFVPGGTGTDTDIHDFGLTSPSLKATSYTVSGLPAASSFAAGTQVVVTDATSLTPGTCSGGGSIATIAITDGVGTWNCL